jgi:hypothetical protein
MQLVTRVKERAPPLTHLLEAAAAVAVIDAAADGV